MRVAIVGVGLMGGSIGMAARERLGARVRGYDASAEVLERALQAGAIDERAGDLAGAVEGAEAVFLATPVGSLPATVRAALESAGPGCVVSDVGSTKSALVQEAHDQRFVGGHPLAGAEGAGVAQARADLFEGATWYLTPTRQASGVLYERLHRMLVGIGAQPAAIEAEAHDRLMARLSHLPHVLANVLVGQAATAVAGTISGLAGGVPGPSFRDATRVAGANSDIWTDIYLANREELLASIEETTVALGRVRAMLEAGERQALRAWNERARGEKERLAPARGSGGAAQELRAVVPNRPGVIAEIALALGEAGVNIADMALAPTADERQGVVSLWVPGGAQAQSAQRAVSALGFAVVLA